MAGQGRANVPDAEEAKVNVAGRGTLDIQVADRGTSLPRN
jgi:hypothetical protein